jgi:protoheme IX farnesyltransferase
MGLYLILIAGLVSHLRPSATVKLYAQRIGVLFLVQVFAGFFNFLLLAPIWIQLIHLLLADVVWIYVVLLAAAALAEGVPQAELAKDVVPITGKASWKDYLALTKPRVISLLLFTTLAAMFIAAPGWPGFWLLAAVAVGGYMAAGAANTFNMVIERDLDGKMTRTSSRPTVTQKISSRNALMFGFLLTAGSFGLLWLAANLLAAVLAFAGLVFYVIVYTLFLKRRTWQNIVIGGAAGAFPPLVGWAAVHNDLSALAWYLFAIIFVWTPVHFWALALLIKEEYAAAGVPMLPVVRSERFTVSQIALYTAITVAASALPFLLPGVGWIYLVGVVLLNAYLVVKSAQLYRAPDRPRASSLFHYSMLYLALLFLFLAIDRSMNLQNPFRNDRPARVAVFAGGGERTDLPPGAKTRWNGLQGT